MECVEQVGRAPGRTRGPPVRIGDSRHGVNCDAEVAACWRGLRYACLRRPNVPQRPGAARRRTAIIAAANVIERTVLRCWLLAPACGGCPSARTFLPGDKASGSRRCGASLMEALWKPQPPGSCHTGPCGYLQKMRSCRRNPGRVRRRPLPRAPRNEGVRGSSPRVGSLRSPRMLGF
jgi:hypothetical protein